MSLRSDNFILGMIEGMSVSILLWTLIIALLVWSTGCAATPSTAGSGKVSGVDQSRSISAGGNVEGLSGAEVAEILATVFEAAKWMTAAVAGCLMYWLGVRPLTKPWRRKT